MVGYDIVCIGIKIFFIPILLWKSIRRMEMKVFILNRIIFENSIDFYVSI